MSSAVNLPVKMLADSMASAVENAQQLPHCSWFLTGVTAPLSSLFEEKE